jgi:hypothetical protein
MFFVKLKSLDSNSSLSFDSKSNKGKHIINMELGITIYISKVQLEEPKKPKEGEKLFHSRMWVKWTRYISLLTL